MHGNRNLALARSRYNMTVCSTAGTLVDTKLKHDSGASTDTHVMSQTWEFTNHTMYDIDPKYQSACVKLRSVMLAVTRATPDSGAAVAAAPTLLGHANLDGADDHLEITMPNDTSALSWTEDWSLGMHLVEIHNATEGLKRTIATRGNNGMYFSKGSGNWGFYATAVDGHHDPASNEGMSHSHGANTWFVPPDDSKHLFTYEASSGKLRWYCDDVLRATVQMTATEMTKGVLATDTLNIGDQMGGYYGGGWWDGHIDNLLIMHDNLVDNSQQVTEYFSNNDFDTHLEYSDKITSWFELDPDPATYPAIIDTLGNATGLHSGGNVETAFVATGEAPAAAVTASVAASSTSSGFGTPEVFFRLSGTQMPNSSQLIQEPNGRPDFQSVGPSTILAVVPTARVDVLTKVETADDPADDTSTDYQIVSQRFDGSAASTGKWVSSTVVNQALRITIECPLRTYPGGDVIWQLGEEIAAGAEYTGGLDGVVDWSAELDIQLLVNAPDSDDLQEIG